MFVTDKLETINRNKMKKTSTLDYVVYAGIALIAIGITITFIMYNNGQFGQH